MSRRAFREMVSCVLVLLFPTSMLAADSDAAMLYTHSAGAAWVNGASIPSSSSAIFSGDLVQTRADTVAEISSPGSSVTVLSDSVVRFDGSSVRIEHGGVAVSTSKGVASTAGDVRVAPISKSWTEFDVTDVDGAIRIAARKGDVTVSDSEGSVTLAQGQETTRDESSDQSGKEKKKKSSGRSAQGAQGSVLDSVFAVGIGAVAVAGIATWVLVQSGNPASPSKP